MKPPPHHPKGDGGQPSEAVARARVNALREAAGWVAAFDQDQTGWVVSFDRPTVRKMVQGLRAMADHAEARLSPSRNEHSSVVSGE